MHDEADFLRKLLETRPTTPHASSTPTGSRSAAMTWEPPGRGSSASPPGCSTRTGRRKTRTNSGDSPRALTPLAAVAEHRPWRSRP